MQKLRCISAESLQKRKERKEKGGKWNNQIFWVCWLYSLPAFNSSASWRMTADPFCTLIIPHLLVFVKYFFEILLVVLVSTILFNSLCAACHHSDEGIS